MANLLLSEGSNYRGLVDELKSKYIVLNRGTALGKFYAVASWGDRDSSEYFGVYSVPDKGAYKTIMLFYPEYYKTLVSRLYNFDGEAVVPDRVVVITFTDDNVVTEAKQFPSYQDAQGYISSAGVDNIRIVGPNPAISPVILDKVEGYELVYGSAEVVNGMPEVKIFEYRKK